MPKPRKSRINTPKDVVDRIASTLSAADQMMEHKRVEERRTSVLAINRAIAHLKDYHLRLTEDGYSGMAEEVRATIDGLTTPACLLGGRAVGTATLRNFGFNRATRNWELQSVEPDMEDSSNA